MTKIVAISGSLRQGSYNTALLRVAQSYLPKECQMDIVSLKNIPLYNQDDEDAQGVPTVVTELKDKIAKADAVLISTPEYNYSISGVLKNAIDWCSRPTKDIPRVFHQRKVGLIGASAGRLGTALSQTALLSTLRYLNMHFYCADPLFVASAYTIFNDKGGLVDKTTADLLKKYMEGFVKFISISGTK